MHQDFLAAIVSLSNQFRLLQNAHDKHEFIELNKWLHLELMEVQEMLVNSGYMDPRVDFTDLDTRMKAAKEVFYSYCSAYAPEMMSPQMNDLYNAINKDIAFSTSF